MQPLNAEFGIVSVQPNSILEQLPNEPAVFKFLQFENTPCPMFVTLSGIVILVKLAQPSNAELPILVTLSGIVILVKLVQPKNAELPMLVTLSGIVMLVNDSQYLKATANINLHPSFTEHELIYMLSHFINAT